MAKFTSAFKCTQPESLRGQKLQLLETPLEEGFNSKLPLLRYLFKIPTATAKYIFIIIDLNI